MHYNHSHYNKLTISGTTYKPGDLLQLCHDKLHQTTLPNWEIALYKFIRQWLNNSTELEIKTSGSTGIPKIIKTSKQAMLKSAFNTLDFFDLHPGQSALLCLSCNFIAGKMMVVRAFAGNLDLIPVPVSGYPLAGLERPVDFAAMTPLQMDNEINAKSNKTNLLRTVILGGSATGSDLSRKLQNQPFKVWETYGMTETLSHIAVRPVNTGNIDRFFTPFKNISLSTDDRGCLLIEAPGIASHPIITNDLAEITNDGKFRIKGRVDNIINTGGIKVSPEEIETLIAPLIDQPFFVSSMPHPVLGQELVLIVENEPENKITLLETIKKALPPYHHPKRIIVKNPLSRTGSGKITRRL